MKEETIEKISKKLEFFKPKLESSLKENQSLNAKVVVLGEEKSTVSFKKIQELEEMNIELEHKAKEEEILAIKSKDLEDENLQQKK